MPPALVILGVALLWPVLGMAQQAGEDRPPSHQQFEDAYGACGGPPIQNGMNIQPTPERDKCLSQHLGLKGREPSENSSQLAGPPQPPGPRYESTPDTGREQ